MRIYKWRITRLALCHLGTTINAIGTSSSHPSLLFIIYHLILLLAPLLLLFSHTSLIYIPPFHISSPSFLLLFPSSSPFSPPISLFSSFLRHVTPPFRPFFNLTSSQSHSSPSPSNSYLSFRLSFPTSSLPK